MDQLTPSFRALLAPYAFCFRHEVFATFSWMVAAWVVCLGRRTVSRVWETTGRSAQQSHCSAFRLFSWSLWNWDEVCRILIVQLLAALVPANGGRGLHEGATDSLPAAVRADIQVHHVQHSNR